jgi:hypothetical protein
MPVNGSILFQGQYINAPGVNSGAPLVDNGGNLAFGLYNNEVNSSAAITVTTTVGVIGSATVTPVAGTYLVIASGNITASSAAGNILTFQIYVGGTAQADTKRTAMPTGTGALNAFQNMTISTNKLVTVNGSQAIALEAVTSAGTITVTGLNFDVVRLA